MRGSAISFFTLAHVTSSIFVLHFYAAYPTHAVEKEAARSHFARLRIFVQNYPQILFTI